MQSDILVYVRINTFNLMIKFFLDKIFNFIYYNITRENLDWNNYNFQIKNIS